MDIWKHSLIQLISCLLMLVVVDQIYTEGLSWVTPITGELRTQNSEICSFIPLFYKEIIHEDITNW